MERSRRHVLAAAGTLLSAGCIGTGPATPAGDSDTESTPDESPTGTDDCTSGITLSAEPYDPSSDLPIVLNDLERSIVETAASEGSAEYVTYGSEPLRADVFARQDETFYRTEYDVTATETVPAYTMDLFWEEGQTAPDDATVVHFEDLPESDQTALEAAALDPETEGEGDGLPQSTLSIQQYPAPYPDDGETSRLVGGRTWIRWRDQTMRVDVAGSADGTKERRTLTYTLTAVATDEEEFRAFVADEYLVTLGDLPSEERSILTKAIGDSYQECAPASASLSALQDRLPADAHLPHPHDDAWYVAFEGERYRLRSTKWVH
jgi:hypothetical protein